MRKLMWILFLAIPSSLTALLTWVASSETRGDGVRPETMDFFAGVQYPHLSLLIPSVKNRGEQVEVVNWEDQQIDWSTKDKIILGPVWGYTKKISQFIAWLNRLEKAQVHMTNSPPFLRWNIQKNYLLDLQKNKIAIPPTLVIPSDSNLSFAQAVALFRQTFFHADLILKGVMDAGAFGYLHVDPENLREAETHFQKLKCENGGVIFQQFLPEIYKKGELAFVFLGNQMSHFFLKVPPYDEERVQPFYGGKSFHFQQNTIREIIEQIRSNFRNDIEITEPEIRAAHKQVGQIYEKLLLLLQKLGIPFPGYLRIDGVMVKGKFVVMELEGIEPYLEMREAMQNDPSNPVALHYIDRLVFSN